MWKSKSPVSQKDPLDDEDDDENTAQMSSTQEDDMPLLKYSRVMGDLPRGREPQSPLSKPISCSTMGKLVLTDETLDNSNTNNASVVDPWKNRHPIFLTAYGFDDGNVMLVESQSGCLVATEEQLQVREGRQKEKIVGLSFDASGTFLAAIDQGGACAIFEFKYTIEMRESARSTGANNMFSSLVSAFRRNDTNTEATLIPTLVASSVQIHRITYPNSFGKPTCIVIDPSYKRKREKAFVAGFNDGKLVLTKKGFVFQRRNDNFLYQASASDDKSYRGIEAVAWRGDLLAWADETGVRLMDSEQWTRIAHIDRPAGARPSLYPFVKGFSPCLVFETSRDLLVAWGDCLLSLKIQENTRIAQNTDASPHADQATSGNGNSTSVVRRRHVECKMAWQLDCVACGVAPFDSKHVAILGIVEPAVENDSNEVELQILSRHDGSIVMADLLPVSLSKKDQGGGPESTTSYSLLSSFAVQRMEDAIEQYEESPQEVDFDPLQGNMFGRQSQRRFVDYHMKWDVTQSDFNRRIIESFNPETSSDDESTDSDDYDFIARYSMEGDSQPPISLAPCMVVCVRNDTLYSRTRNIDDAVAFAIDHGRPALALKYAISSGEVMRRYSVDEVVDEYLSALLRLSSIESSRTKKRTEDTTKLSLRRMQKAASTMPVLLGGKVDRWKKWIDKLDTIPGFLFVLRPHLPVRDPRLPKGMYTQLLQKMLDQLKSFRKGRDDVADEVLAKVVLEAEQHCLNTLACWGNLSSLHELSMHFERSSATSLRASTLAVLKDGLRHRNRQSSSNFLNFSVGQANLTSTNQGVSSPPDDESLFDQDALLHELDRQLELTYRDGSPSSVLDIGYSTRFLLTARAWLSLSRNNSREALGYFLEVGFLDLVSDLKSLEQDALARVSGGKSCETADSGSTYVLSLIEYSGLHEELLHSRALPFTKHGTPFIALMRLVRIAAIEEFVIQLCVGPRSVNSKAENTDRKGTLPLDTIAAQLQDNSKLLLWFLDCMFRKRSDIFVKFPTTTLPPKAITDLHRRAISLYIEFSDDYIDSSSFLEKIEGYRVTEAKTPLLAFLEAVLPLGRIPVSDVSALLNSRVKDGDLHTFALERAYIKEYFPIDEETSSEKILDLYLIGARSIMLAASYVQRNKALTANMWDVLIDHCLGKRSEGEAKVDGTLFGSLLEAAALSGADLAYIVGRIPRGMAIEGLRPKLVGAISDYELKLTMHMSCFDMAQLEKTQLFSEKSQRSRRGARCDESNDNRPSVARENGYRREDKPRRFPRTKNRESKSNVEALLRIK